jgi:hypothetical protein
VAQHVERMQNMYRSLWQTVTCTSAVTALTELLAALENLGVC